MSDTALKQRITARVLACRKSGGVQAPQPFTPRYAEAGGFMRPDGRLSRRLKVILMSGGCSVPTCTMCFFTNHNNYGQEKTRKEMIVEQVRDILRQGGPLDGCDAVSLYNDGSFFAPREISDQARLSIAALVAGSGVTLLTVESLPQFISEARLAPFLAALGKVELEVGIGLQSAHPQVREYSVNTSFDNECYANAVRLLKRLGVHVKTYVLLKPPFLTENEAIADALQSINYCRSLDAPYITLCPVSVSPHTLLWELMEAKEYAPLSLWSIVDTAIRAPKDVVLRVVGFNLRGTYTIPKFPDACPQCAVQVRNSIGQYSLGKFDLATLSRCVCAPSPNIPHDPIDGNTLLERIRETLQRLESVSA